MRLCELVDGIPHTGADGREIDGVTYDSRCAKAGSLFVCLTGARTDGHRYAKSAYQNGCRAFLVERALELPSDAVQVQTPDTRAALAVIGADFYARPAQKLRLLGITGTKGKTTTACLTAAILNESGVPCAYIGTNGVQIGQKHYETVNTTPESLELQRFFRMMVDDGIRCVAMEVSSQALAHHRVDGLTFDAVAFTNFSADHIGPGEHPDLNDYKASKRRLFTEHGANVMVYNADDPVSAQMRAGFLGRQIGFARNRQADYRGVDLRPFRDETTLGVAFTCRFGEREKRIRLLSPGAFSVDNALCAIALCASQGIGVDSCATVLTHTSVRGRFEVVKAVPGRTFLIDYAHNGASLCAVLQTLRAYQPHRLVCVFGSVGGRTQLRRRELALAASQYADYSIITSDNPDFEDPSAIMAQIAADMLPGAAYTCIASREEAITTAVMQSKPGDIVLFAGKGQEEYQLIEGRKVPFSERACILQAARKKSGFLP